MSNDLKELNEEYIRFTEQLFSEMKEQLNSLNNLDVDSDLKFKLLKSIIENLIDNFSLIIGRNKEISDNQIEIIETLGILTKKLSDLSKLL
jgi:frataxin-like iron-binding protein CyaY